MSIAYLTADSPWVRVKSLGHVVNDIKATALDDPAPAPVVVVVDEEDEAEQLLIAPDVHVCPAVQLRTPDQTPLLQVRYAVPFVHSIVPDAKLS